MIKNTYVEALIVTIFIFFSGIMVGIWIDNYRVSKVRKELLSDTVFWDDSLFLTKFTQLYGGNSCQEALKMNLLYNQKIYQRGKEIEDAIKLNKFTPEMKEELKRYTLMQIQFWLNSIELKKKCNFTYHTVVHLQQFFPKTEESRVENKAQSNVMLNLKNECGGKIMLIPISVDLNLTSAQAILLHYNITKLPAIIIDEKYVFQGLTSIDTLRKYTGC